MIDDCPTCAHLADKHVDDAGRQACAECPVGIKCGFVLRPITISQESLGHAYWEARRRRARASG